MIMHSICIHIYWEKKRGIWKIVYLKQLEHTKLQRLAPARSSQPVTVYRKNHYMCFYRRILHESNPSLVEHKIPAILQYVPNGQASQVQCFYHNSVGHPRQFVFWYLDTGKQEKWLRSWDTVLRQAGKYMCTYAITLYWICFVMAMYLEENKVKIVVQTKQLYSSNIWHINILYIFKCAIICMVIDWWYCNCFCNTSINSEVVSES